MADLTLTSAAATSSVHDYVGGESSIFISGDFGEAEVTLEASSDGTAPYIPLTTERGGVLVLRAPRIVVIDIDSCKLRLRQSGATGDTDITATLA